ncbi:hypothetical protein [Egbenema bharatensis]|uniref:hypothetical protein n=1 Tax=Egbenema bharatensis TaxID=3463334 RepID=UPI003A84BBED
MSADFPPTNLRKAIPGAWVCLFWLAQFQWFLDPINGSRHWVVDESSDGCAFQARSSGTNPPKFQINYSDQLFCFITLC